MPKIPVIRTSIEVVNARLKEGGTRMTRGVVNDYTHRVTEAEIGIRAEMGLEADDVHVDTDYGYEISTAARHARRRAV